MEDKPEHFREVVPAWIHHCFAGNPESCQCYHQQPLKNEEEGSSKGKGILLKLFFKCYIPQDYLYSGDPKSGRARILNG